MRLSSYLTKTLDADAVALYTLSSHILIDEGAFIAQCISKQKVCHGVRKGCNKIG